MSIKQNILVTVDTLILANKNDEDYLLLVKRKNDPYKDQWAFPGGFVEDDEPLIKAAARELKEETNIDAHDLTQFRAFGEPGRDPRGRTVSVVFFGCIDQKKMDEAKGADDAKEAQWHLFDQLPSLAFDHEEIIDEFRKFLKR